MYPVYFCVLKLKVFEKTKLFLFIFIFKLIFLMFLDYFDVLISKIIFKNKKNIILIHFRVKSTLKSNCNHISKHALFGNMIETAFSQISKIKFAKIYFFNIFLIILIY
jgi:hypothetical protein